MYQQQESQQRNRLGGFLYLELALTMLTLSVASIAFICCLINGQIIQLATTEHLQACQNFSAVCFQLRAQHQIPATHKINGIKKKKTTSLVQEIEVPKSPHLNTQQPLQLLCLR